MLLEAKPHGLRNSQIPDVFGLRLPDLIGARRADDAGRSRQDRETKIFVRAGIPLRPPPQCPLKLKSHAACSPWAEYTAMGEAGILHKDGRVELLAGEVIQMAAIGNRCLFCTDALNMLPVLTLSGRAIVRAQGSITAQSQSSMRPLASQNFGLPTSVLAK